MTGDKLIANVLTIAGSDPTGGAGIQADLKAFSAMRTYGMTVITAVTAQNTQGVRAFQALDASFVADQIDAVFDDVEVRAVKIGMVANADIAMAIADRLAHHRAASIVLDPVMVAKSGDILLQPDAVAAIRDVLVPMSTVVTPNLAEAAVLLGRSVPESVEEMREILPDLLKLGSRWVLLKGGHLPDAEIIDILYGVDETVDMCGPRIASNNLHGTGCTLSAAIAAMLTRHGMIQSVKTAREYLTQALAESACLKVGKGKGPVHHFHAMWGG